MPVFITVPVSLPESTSAALQDANRDCASGSRSGEQSCRPKSGEGIHPNRVSSRHGGSAVFPHGQRPF